GGIEASRVFTKIHLAMFGLIPWEACPVMPPELVFMPNWFPINIYQFSSWARATIVPMTIICATKPVQNLPEKYNIEELFANPPDKRDFSFKLENRPKLSWENFFIQLDKFLKYVEKSPIKPLRNTAIQRCADWTWAHVEKTEDIYPALAYCALAFKALGYKKDSLQIAKPYKALLKFQQRYSETDVPALPGKEIPKGVRIHQQCCISPVWDTPWTLMALLEAGVPGNDERLLKAGQWLIERQITETRGDWAVKNPHAKPGGWSFEFENEYYPDVDDTIEVLSVLKRLDLPEAQKRTSIALGLEWLLSMQNDDGGWGAFDKNQTLELVNRIPFSDHGACLDPSTPDITARMIEFLAGHGYDKNYKPIKKALKFLWKHQEKFGGWFGRWGINYIYGTWCVLTALKDLNWDMNEERVKRAVTWLKSAQLQDGGWGESPESYKEKKFVSLKRSTASQTAWALMGLNAGAKDETKVIQRGVDFLLNTRRKTDGGWDERDYTGTGFPGHFYIRYHGYRHYFPLLALAKVKNGG
ncbi:MAG: squalene--hopene cyclase, partial [Pseudomonadota bacterium]